MAKKKLSDDDLSVILAKAISNSEHLTDGKLASERESVGRYYRGELPAPLHKGDSKYVSRDVFDTVDSMRATILEAFSANQRIVYFRPERGETVEDSKQATDYCRHVFFKENVGEQVMYDTCTDGLMNRFSITKVFYEEDEDEQEYEFEGLTLEELTMQVEQYDDWDFVETSESPEGLISGSYLVKTKTKKIVTETIQPEDLLVSNNAPSITGAKFVIHRQDKTKSFFVKRFGAKKAELVNYDNSDTHPFEYEKQTRFDAVGSIVGDNESYDESVKEAILYEIYINLDMDGSGKSKLWKIMYAGKQVLAKERISRMPFASYVPLPIPHAFHGENFAKSVIPIQNARTVLFRQIINHSLVTNNPRQQVLNGTLMNPAELLDNRMGGIVNVRRLDGIAPIPQAPLNPFVFNLIGLLDEDKEETTGISKLSQGMNKDAISSQNSQGMVEQLIGASQQRTKIIARRFGLYLKDLYLLIYQTAVDHIDEAEYQLATGAYVPVKPTLWKERSAASVELTLGYGDQDKEAQKWIEVDMAFSKDPQLQPLYTIDKRYQVLTRAMEARGIEDTRSILTPPEEVPEPQPSEIDLLQKKQMEVSIDYQMAQAEAMRAKAKIDLMKAETDRIRAMGEAKIDAQTIMLEQERLRNDIYVDEQELQLAAKASEQKAVYNP